MQELITVVLPIYNVEQYVAECIDSVINQTYQNIEIILVDDGSQDKSGKICDDYKEKDARIQVIHKENGGLSDARNIGIEKARGKYICFVDSDDIIKESYIENLYQLIRKYNVSMAICDFQRIASIKDIKEDTYPKKEIVYEKREILEKIYNKSTYVQTTVAWNKLYDITLFKKHKFPKGKLHEDEYTTYQLYYDIDKVVMTTEKLYYYRYVPQSIMHKAFSLKRLDGIQALEERMMFFKEKKEEHLYNLTLIQYESILMIHYMNCKLYLKEEKDIQNELWNKYKKMFKKVITLKEISLKDKIKLTVARISPNVYYYSKKWIKRILKNG